MNCNERDSLTSRYEIIKNMPLMSINPYIIKKNMYLPNPSTQTECDTKSIFKQSLTGLNSEFSFSYTSCHTKIKKHSVTYYLLIATERIASFISFADPLALCKMQTASSSI